MVSHRRGEHVRQAVLTAAFEELSLHGVHSTIADVATRCGVHETTIYRRWATKENLFVDALLTRSAEAIPVPDTGSIRGDLLAIAHAVNDYLGSPPGVGVWQAVLLRADSAYDEARRQFWKTRRDALRPVVERAIARHELQAGANAQLLLEALAAPLHTRAFLTGEPVDQTFIENLVDLLLDGAHARR